MKPIIYQVFPRILTNTVPNPLPNGSLEQNGCGKMNHYTPRLLKAIRDLGCTAVWYTGIIEHATKTEFPGIPADNPHVVKGEAGSPYAIKDYYDVAPALAEDVPNRMKEFEELVERTHAAGLKVVIDFVPNHTARSYHSDSAPVGLEDFGQADDRTMFFSPRNNYYYITNQQFSPSFDIFTGGNPYIEFPAKATGNDCFNAFCSEYDWYETVKLNYGHDYGDGSDHFDPVPDTWLKMLHILRFWASKGVDGFRCDMVFMVPLAFWHWVIPQVKQDWPDVFFMGEIYDIGQYRPFIDYGGFDYLYDKVGLYDTLVGIERFNYSAARITGCWQAVDGLGDSIVNFLENHDEVRFGSREFAGDPMRVIPYLVVSSMISTGPFLLYYGQELGEQALDNEGFAGDNNRTTIFDYWSYDTMRRWYDEGRCTTLRLTQSQRSLRKIYARILGLCNSRPEISEGGFYDLMYANLQNPGLNPHRHFAFIRHHEGKALLIVANFDDTDSDVAVNIPNECIDLLGLRMGEGIKTDLLSGSHVHISLRRDEPVVVPVGAMNAVIIEL